MLADECVIMTVLRGRHAVNEQPGTQKRYPPRLLTLKVASLDMLLLMLVWPPCELQSRAFSVQPSFLLASRKETTSWCPLAADQSRASVLIGTNGSALVPFSFTQERWLCNRNGGIGVSDKALARRGRW